MRRTYDADQIDDPNAHLGAAPAQDVLRWAVEAFGDRAALASSFGAEDMVLIDMLSRIRSGARVITLDTGRLPQETYDLIEIVRARYGEVEVYFPRAEAVEEMARRYGPNLFYGSVEMRKLCCNVRKVEPLRRALSNLDAWITGLRREQTPSRSGVDKVEWDAANGGLWKINPLADWTWGRVWSYIQDHSVPYHALHDRGYPSIGCAPCTRAIRPGEDQRAGRWWWEQDAHKECGLHPAAGEAMR